MTSSLSPLLLSVAFIVLWIVPSVFDPVESTVKIVDVTTPPDTALKY
jgi:hypothetical protein